MAVPNDMGNPMVQKARKANRPSKITATIVSSTAGTKMRGWLAPIKSESTKPVANPSSSAR